MNALTRSRLPIRHACRRKLAAESADSGKIFAGYTLDLRIFEQFKIDELMKSTLLDFWLLLKKCELEAQI